MNTMQPAELKTGETPPAKDSGNGSPEKTASRIVQERNREAGICIALFLSALFVIIAISSPALFMNDEWITVNQLHQLSIGHQFTTNEGKYGTYPDGTPSAYFDHILNILIYTMALPVVSMPALMALQFCGDYFRFATILFWSTLPFFIALSISRCFPEHATLGHVRITILGAGAGAFLFAINRFFYVPFAGSPHPGAPVEVAAVVFTNHLFFALMIVMTYLIAQRIFNNRRTSLFIVLACTACSTILLWGGTAKDHMASAAVFAIMLWFFIAYLQSRRLAYAAGGFFAIGILAWFRPEIGLSVFFCLVLFYLAIIFLSVWQKRETIGTGLMRTSAILFTLVGAIPLFINNILVSGNPLVPPILMLRNLLSSGTTSAITPVSQGIFTGDITTTNSLIANSDFIATLKTYLFSSTQNPGADLLGIFFFPQHGSIGFFIIVPVALLALVLIPFLLFQKSTGEVIAPKDKEISALLLVATASIFIAYLNILNSLNTDVGLAPDIRYLIPAYLPATLLGFVLLRKTVLLADTRHLFRSTGIVAMLVAAMLVAAVFLFTRSGSINLLFLYQFCNILVLAEVLVIALLVYLSPKMESVTTILSEYSLPVLILTVLGIQLFLILVLVPAAKFNGYSFWLPGADVIYYSILKVVIAS